MLAKTQQPLQETVTKYRKNLTNLVFSVLAVSYGPSSARIYGPSAKKQGSVTYSTDRENEVSKILIISLGQRDILHGD